MKFADVFKNRYCISVLFLNVWFIVVNKLKCEGAFIETPYPSLSHLIVGWGVVFLLSLKIKDLRNKILSLFIYTVIPYLLFGLFGAHYNIVLCIYNLLTYFSISFAISSACIKSTERTRYAAIFSLFLHTGLSIVSYIISYGKMLNSFQRIFFLSPLQRFSFLDVPIQIPELVIYISLFILLYINPLKKSKLAVMTIVFGVFFFSSGVAGDNLIPRLKYIDNIELTFSIYDDYALFYGNKINTGCVYKNNKETAYDFYIKAKENSGLRRTVSMNRKDKYFNVYATVTTKSGIKIKRKLENVSLLCVNNELDELRKCNDFRNNNPVYKTRSVNHFTVNDRIYKINMNKLLNCIYKDVRENHTGNVILYEIKFHEIREGRVLKTICISVCEDDINTVDFLTSSGIKHIYEEMPRKLKKYKVDFNISGNTDFYEITEGREYEKVAGFVSRNLIPYSPEGRVSAFFVNEGKYVYLPQPALKNGAVYLENK